MSFEPTTEQTAPALPSVTVDDGPWSTAPFFTPTPSQDSRRPTRFLALAAIALVVVVVIGVAIAARGQSAGSTYRTATVARHSVAQVLDGVGTIEPVSQAAVAFPVAGTVSAVHVKIGNSVAVGDALASLDETSLEQALHTAQASSADASLNLERALSGQAVETGGGSSGSGRSATNTSAGSFASAAFTGSAQIVTVNYVPGGVGSSPTGGGLAAAQNQVLAAQKAVDAKLRQAETALAGAQQVCSGVAGGSGPTTTTSTTSTTMPGNSAGNDVAACQEALTGVLAAQQDVASAQQVLSTAASQLDVLIAGQANQTGRTGSSAATGNAATTQSGNGTRSPGTGTSSGTSSTSPSAAKLVAYQKAVDAADAAVTAAQQALAQSTIVSPIAGTVAAVGVITGTSVTAASTTSTILVVGNGGYEATTRVPVAEVPHIKVGQTATVTPDGAHSARTGRVVAVGLAGTTSNSGATTYPVTIGLNGDTSTLGNGSTASIAIQTGSASAAIAVPTSAVTTLGRRHLVSVLDAGKVTATVVGVGAVGGTWTQITSGLTTGQVVVLADLTTPLPGSATTSSSSSSSGNGSGSGRRGTTGGGFGGGGGSGRIGGG